VTVPDRLRDRVVAWIDDDPDAETRRELTALLSRAAGGDEAAVSELEDRFLRLLEFGTAGLRGALGGGPNRMNRAVVLRAAAGLTAYLQTDCAIPEPMVVVGFDARRQSDVFARDTAAVVCGAGGRAAILPYPMPTPVLAFAIRHLGADAGVMVTASHNPRPDNGYKVYLGDGGQIVPPVDARISTHIAAVASVRDLMLADDGWETLGDEVRDEYVRRVAALVPRDSPREVSLVHTALHGVGDDILRRVLADAGFPPFIAVAQQADPDPEFPTVPFPNPEESGAMDAALTLARQVHPDLVLANDPDADRCAAAVLGSDDWRMLNGDEEGVLLGWHLLRRGVPPDGVLASSLVSSRLLSAMADATGLRHEETLTGFKWIARVPGLVYGYEEALGYCVAPQIVHDKDGISAALLFTELVAGLKRDGRTVLDILDELAIAHGVYLTDSFSVRMPEVTMIGPVLQRLRAQPPDELGESATTKVDDLSRGVDGLPPTEGMRWFFEDGSRVVVRPSGTEPKLKVYLEVVEPVRAPDALGDARHTAVQRMSKLRAAAQALVTV
jgi:phosphomannomutase